VQDTLTRFDKIKDTSHVSGGNLGNVDQITPKVGEVLRVSKIPSVGHDNTNTLIIYLHSGVDIDNPRKTDDTTVDHLDLNSQSKGSIFEMIEVIWVPMLCINFSY
jgi:hypothetical protein